MTEITRRDFLRGIGIAGLALVLPPLGFSALEDPKKFNPNHKYGRGAEYTDRESYEFAIRLVKKIAERALPKGTPYVLIKDPGSANYGRTKVIYWLYHPGLRKRCHPRRPIHFMPEIGGWIIGYFRT